MLDSSVFHCKIPFFFWGGGGWGVLPPSFFPSDLLHIHLQFLSAFPLGVTKWFSFLSSPPPICCTPPPPYPNIFLPLCTPHISASPFPLHTFLPCVCLSTLLPPTPNHTPFYLPPTLLSASPPSVFSSLPPPPRPPNLATPASVSPFPLLPAFLHHPVCLLSYDLCLPCPLPPPLSWKGVLVKWDRSVCVA